MQQPLRIGFLGAGGIAQAHAYALDALKYYYPDAPEINKIAVASPTYESRTGFAERFGFNEALSPEQIWQREDLDTLYLLGPNETHTPQLLRAVKIPTIKRIYVEKPIGISRQEILSLEDLNTSQHDKIIMVGFQYLQKSPLRKALRHWQSGVFGEPVHFSAEYLHSSYLDRAYRQKHPDRLKPIPVNGAAADLGAHSLSLLTAFLGNTLIILDAFASGNYPDVPEQSDLCTTALIEEPTSGAIGTLVASRVSPGTGDHFSLEIYGARGTLIFTTKHPDSYQTFLPDVGWQRHEVNSDYQPASKFPSDYAPSGWLRAMVHNHYLFLGGDSGISFMPDLTHGIQVQRLLQQIAENILSG